jgi:hypothetical protein
MTVQVMTRRHEEENPVLLLLLLPLSGGMPLTLSQEQPARGNLRYHMTNSAGAHNVFSAAAAAAASPAMCHVAAVACVAA